MSRFIHTSHGDINLDYVLSARDRYPKGEQPYTEVRYLEGRDVLTAKAYTTISLEAHTAPVVRAEPGYSVVAVLGPPPYEAHAEPVIAWRIEHDYARPICPGDSITSATNRWGILMPSGKVQMPCDCTYGSMTEFLQQEGVKLAEEAASREQRIMTPKCAGAPYSEFIKKGWTDAQLIEHGYMLKASA